MSNTVRAVLFDLDGTLLDNDLDVFLPRYFERLAARVAHILPPKEFISRLMQATRKMLVNDGSIINEEAFAAAFYPLDGHPREEMEPIFMDFYAHDYPSLREYTRRKPEARGVVQTAFDLGYVVAVTTNPLFPTTAIEQRLEWAGVDGFPYALVTSYENSRACKPNPIYFQQVMETIGQPASACLVVGYDVVDMAAGQLGSPTFLMDASTTQLLPAPAGPTYRGTRADVETLLLGWGPAPRRS
jgi:FMN phosphatase YigB (HAD superfamily)